MVKFLVDMIPVMLTMVLFSLIMNIPYDREGTLAAFLLVLCLSSLSYQSIGYILGVLFGESAVIASMLCLSLIILFGTILHQIGRIVYPLLMLANLNPWKSQIDHMIIHFYRFNRCPEDQFPFITYKYLLDDHSFDKTLYLLIFQLISFRVLAYCCVKYKTYFK